MHIDFNWHEYKYLPYERLLATREVSTLMTRQPVAGASGVRVPIVSGWEERASRTTYFSHAVAPDGSFIVPLQANLEESATAAQGAGPRQTPPSLSRQSTRYSAHGLHEYRGKFNPQIVRALGNILGLKPGDSILDPFCGSGTAILEAAHNGWDAVGIDSNPLAVQIARAKIAAMRTPRRELNEYTQRVVERLDQRFGGVTFDRAFSNRRLRALGGPHWESMLPNLDYLRCWFTESVLIQLSAILQEIAAVPSEDVGLILKTILSDILRGVSLQDPSDLRIRRLTNPPENVPAVPLFLSSALFKVDQITRAREHLSTAGQNQTVVVADARTYASTRVRSERAHHRFSAALTSPPYATALPYIDTQRLSLALMDHVNSAGLRKQERALIGNREISITERTHLDKEIRSRNAELPRECLAFCRRLQSAVDQDIDGFRRRNTPSLIYKYLLDMAATFRQVQELLAPGSPYALVVGRNQTTLGGTTHVVDTPHLLAVVAEANGFELREMIELDTYPRYSMHQANSIRSETAVILRSRAA